MEVDQLRKALLNSNNQPDDDKQQIFWPYCYQIEALKDDLSELEESHARLQNEYKDKSRTHDLLVRDHKQLEEEQKYLQHCLIQREKLIQEHGLILVNLSDGGDDPISSASSLADGHHSHSHHGHPQTLPHIPPFYQPSVGSSGPSRAPTRPPSSTPTPTPGLNGVGMVNGSSVSSMFGSNRDLQSSASTSGGSGLFSGPTLISRDIIQLLESFDGSTLEDKLKCMAEEREDLLREIKRLKLDVEEERAQHEDRNLRGSMSSITMSEGGSTIPNGGSSPEADVKKMLHEYKFRLKRAEQEIITLQGNGARMETQMTRYKTLSEELEKREDELKSEKRKILRELREYQTKAEELETQNSHLQKRIHKLKENRMAIINGNP